MAAGGSFSKFPLRRRLSRRTNRGLQRLRSLTLGLQYGLEFTTLVHFGHDVAAADELAVDEDLRNSRPLREVFERIPERIVGEHVDRNEIVGAGSLQNLHRARGETALRKLGGPLHEDDHFAGFHFFFDLRNEGMCHGGYSPMYFLYWSGLNVRIVS